MLSRDCSRNVFGDVGYDGGNYNANSGKKEKAGPAIHLTEKAAKKIIALLEKDGVSPQVGGLRVGVQGGGGVLGVVCNAARYAIARSRQDIRGVWRAVFVDPKSLLYLNGTILEYEETLMRQGFVFQNPNAARNCGCGSRVLRRKGRTGFSLSAGLTQQGDLRNSRLASIVRQPTFFVAELEAVVGTDHGTLAVCVRDFRGILLGARSRLVVELDSVVLELS